MKTKAGPLAFISLPLLASSLAFLLLSFAASTESRTERRLLGNEGQATWCIAKPSTENEQLGRNIQYSCAQNGVDCRLIQPGGNCFRPDSPVSHASVAMNLFYKAAGKHPWNCYFNATGLIVTQNPSVGSCNYPV